MAALQPNPFGEEHLCQESTVLRVEQKHWSWFKNTGRGFNITFSSDESSFITVDTKRMGKHRTFQDKHAETLCSLERNYFSKKHAWILTHDSEKLLTVRYSCLPWKLTVKIESIADQEPSEDILEIKNLGIWFGSFVVTLGDWTIMRLRCTNMMNMFSFTPPVWEMDVVKGTDLVLVSH